MPPPLADPSTLPELSTEDADKLKKLVQDAIGPGLVLIVGSGLSVAEGVSGMTALSARLLAAVPSQLPKGQEAAWKSIAIGLAAGRGLEEVLLAHPPTPQIEKLIVDETAGLVRTDEATVLRQVVAGARTLRLTRLLRQFPRSSDPIDIVTPNYDRLIEFAAEDAELGVDAMFLGGSLGRYDEQACGLSFLERLQPTPRKGLRKVMAPRIRLCKPHGSLDWCMRGNKPTRISPEFIDTPLIITPGLNKYRHGYSVPFDRHRERANTCIDNATRFLVIGYGFNDDHLETHLSPAIRAGRPTMIVTHTLSPTARQLAGTCEAVVGLEHAAGSKGTGTAVWRKSGGNFIPGAQLWNLGDLVKEVFGG
jgi:hypothetical protein